ncbi:MAG: DNA polymerase III subunit delta' [Planctomycetia bacterium]|jgi:DNA polymerase-3 subunit delta'
MTWHGIEGHDTTVERFRRALDRGRLASSFLFVGPAGIGKRTFALRLAQALLCDTNDEAQLNPCGACASCKQVNAGTHPDVIRVEKPKDRAYIPIELLIGDRDHRMQQGLCHEISLKPFKGGRKIAIIDDADLLNIEGANALLKTLEEPPPQSVLILIGTSPARQLPTIRSRCQTIRFEPLPSETVARLLVEQGVVSNDAEAAPIAERAEGSLEMATELADPALWEFRKRLFTQLNQPRLESVRTATMVSKFVDEAGRDAPARRARLRYVIRFAIEFYRERLLELSTNPDAAEPMAARLERSLDALQQIDRNANQTTLIECWIDDLC